MSFFLNAGNLVSQNDCTIGDYVIEWRLEEANGEIVFVSANVGNLDEGIDTFHPIEDEIVEAGNLYPIFKYVWIGGQRYTPYPEEGSIHSPDLITCLLPRITVEAIECGDSNYTGIYDYMLIREVNQGDKSRTLRFLIDEFTDFLAWGFDTINIADQIELFYCTADNPQGEIIDSIVFGASITANYTPSNYPRQPGYDSGLPVTPIVVSSPNSTTTDVFKYISDLRDFTYQAGDFIKIRITGNYFNPELDNTKWTLYLKCFEELPELYNFLPGREIDGTITPTLTYDDVTCRYNLSYSLITASSTLASNLKTTGLGNYLYIQSGSLSDPQINWREGVSLLGVGSVTSGCNQSSGQITITKDATGILYTFADSNDYDAMVSEINNIHGHSRYTDFQNLVAGDETTNILYYSYYVLSGFQSGAGCDNAGSALLYTVSMHSTIDYVSETSIKFNFPSSAITNQMIDEECNTAHSTAGSVIITLTNTINSSNNTYNSNIKRNNSAGGTFITSQTDQVTTKVRSQHSYIYNILINGMFDPATAGFCATSNYWRALYHYERFSFTDTSSHEARLANWKLERSNIFNGCGDIETYGTLIHEEVGTTTTTTTI